MALPQLTPEQRAAALEKAAQARKVRAELKDKLKRGASDLPEGLKQADEAEIIEFCRDNLARFKAPKMVVFGELPKTPTGKIQKFMLRARAREL